MCTPDRIVLVHREGGDTLCRRMDETRDGPGKGIASVSERPILHVLSFVYLDLTDT